MYARKPGGRSLTDQLGGGAGSALAPGKRTLTDQLGAGPVQLKATGDAAPAPAPTKAAPRLRVEALDARGAVIKAWEGDAHEAAHGRARFIAERQGGRWQWNDADGATTRIGITEDSSGVPIERWAPRGAVRLVVTIGGGTQAPDRNGTGGSGESEHGNEEGDGEGAGKRLPVSGVDLDITDTEHDQGDDQLGAAGQVGENTGDSGDDGGALIGGLAEAFERELERVMGKGEGAAGEGHGKRNGTQTGAVGGTGPGGDHAEAGGAAEHGMRGGISLAEGGVASPTAERGGMKFGDPEGAYGGEGREGDHGARGAVALFGGLVNVPAALRGLVELGLIASDANFASFGSQAGEAFFKAGLRKFATPAAARKAMAREARAIAKSRMPAVMEVLDADAAYKALTKAEQKQVRNIVEWEMQRQFFEGVVDSARKEADELRALIARGDLPEAMQVYERKLAYATRMDEAAQAQPISGRLPINHELAGKQVPDAMLEPGLQGLGLRFTEQGFPDFRPFAMDLPNGTREVRISYTGNRPGDFRAANKAAGLDATPEGWTWHHHEDLGVMVLVPDELHDAIRHTGGVAWYQHTHGITKYGGAAK